MDMEFKNNMKPIKTEKSKRTNEMELAYCKKCVQMTNHKDGVCLKCKSKRTNEVIKDV